MRAEKRIVLPTRNYRAKSINVDTIGAPVTPAHPPKRPERRIIGAIEPVIVRGKRGEVNVQARVDTGASRTTVDADIAARAGLGPVLGTVRIRQSISKQPETRPLVDADLIIGGEEFDVAAAIADRAEMKYHVIIGMDILASGKFLVDPSRASRKKRKDRSE